MLLEAVPAGKGTYTLIRTYAPNRLVSVMFNNMMTLADGDEHRGYLFLVRFRYRKCSFSARPN
jgi:hypothetical protein